MISIVRYRLREFAAGHFVESLVVAHVVIWLRSARNVWTHCLRCPGVPPAFIARLPPSIGMIAPVIHDEASEASSTASP